MTNERAIELLHSISDSQFDGIHGDERRKALEMAVRALEGDGDTIYRQAAIDAMRKLPKWNIMREDYKNVGFSYDDVMFTLEKLTSAQPHWIPCSERLPEKRKENEDTEYLVTIDNGEFKYVTSDYWINWFGNWRWNDSEAIAWMPLPKPYER